MQHPSPAESSPATASVPGTEPPAPRLESVCDPARLAALRATGLLDTPAEEAFDRLTRLAARVLRVPVALVSLVDADRQFFKSAVGLAEPEATTRQTPLSHSFCRYVVASAEPLVVEDARRHPWLRENPAIPDLDVVAYAGMPLVTADGHLLGTVCAVDHQPRAWAEDDIAALRDLAAAAASEIELRAALRASARLAAIVESSADAIFAKSLEGVIESWNAAAEGMYGYTAAEAIGRSVAMLIPPDRAGELAGILARVRGGERVAHLETRRVRKDGAALDVDLSVAPIVGPGGAVVGASTIARDITARARAEAELRERYREAERARAETRAVLDAVEEGIALVAPDRRFVTVNRRFADLFGVRADEVVGERFEELEPLVRRAFADPDTFLGWVAEGPLRDTERDFRTTARQTWPAARELALATMPVRDAGGGYLGRLYVIRDVTRKRAVDRMKSQFVSLVSHEFRTPLTGIQGFSEMIRDEDLALEEIKDFANDINEDAKRLARLVNDMLDLDRLESGRVELSLGPVDPGRLVADAANLARPNAPGHTIALDLGTVPALVADRDRLVQVVTNLLGNAIKYSPGGGAVTLRTRRDGDRAVLEVEDRGLGIPAAMAERIFDRYARVEAGAAAAIQGTGLGLPIARQIARLHGGDIAVRSTPGEGSTFRVELPLAGPAPAGAAEA